MLQEEDSEVYNPQYTVLKQDYDRGIQMLITKGVPQQAQQKGAK